LSYIFSFQYCWPSFRYYFYSGLIITFFTMYRIKTNLKLNKIIIYFMQHKL
jgi:hypothetical protein